MIVKGAIQQLTYDERIDFGKDILGSCWIQRSEIGDKATASLISVLIKNPTRTLIVPSGDSALIQYLVEKINNAKEGICLSSFLIQRGDLTNALLAAAKRGLKVVLLTATKEDLKAAPEELIAGEQEKIEEHKELLDSFAGHVLIRTCGGFHAKYGIIDPHSPAPFGWMMTCNATVAPMKGSNNEIAVTLTPDEAKSLFAHFLKGFWEMAELELLAPGKLTQVRKITGYDPDLGENNLPSTVIGSNTLKEQILSLLNDAKKSITITAWSFEENHEVIRSLEAALSRGVAITVATRPSVKSTKALINLQKNGATVVGHPRYHAKCIIVDDARGLVTTANMTKDGLDSGFEMSIPLEKQDVKSLREIVDKWNVSCNWELKAEARLADVKGTVQIFDEKMKDLSKIEVFPTKDEVLSPFTPESCEKIIAYTISEDQARRTMKKDIGKLYQSVHIQQKIQIPKLPKEATEVKDEKAPFPIYSLGKKAKFVVVNTWEDVISSKDYAAKNGARIVVK